jgi:hypothetical protein
MRLWIEKYGETKFFGLYDGDDLVCVTVYRRGAKEVKKRLEEMESKISLKTKGGDLNGNLSKGK